MILTASGEHPGLLRIDARSAPERRTHHGL